MSTSDMQKETSRMIVKGAVRSLFLTNNKDCFLGAQCIRYYLKKTGIYTLVRKLYNAAMFISALFPNEKFDLQCMMSKRSKYFVDFNHILTSLKKQ